MANEKTTPKVDAEPKEKERELTDEQLDGVAGGTKIDTNIPRVLPQQQPTK